MQRKLGSHDRGKLTEYLDAVRDAERRIQKAEAQSDRELPVLDAPPGVPPVWIDHAKVMLDLLSLAYQTDMTRVATLLVSREGSIRTFPELGISDPWHPLSHAIGSPEGAARQAKLNHVCDLVRGALHGAVARGVDARDHDHPSTARG